MRRALLPTLLTLTAAAAPAADWIDPAAEAWHMPAPPEYRSAAHAGPWDADGVLEGYAQAYRKGKSGLIFWAGEPGVMFTERSTIRNHGSTWDYDRRVPLAFYGPGQIRRKHMGDAAGQSFHIPLTFSALADVPVPGHVEGRAWPEIFEPKREPVRALAIVVLDQVGAHDVERFADRMPNLSRIRSQGANFPEVRNAWLPTVTSCAHAGVGTGVPPRVNGVANNFFMKPDKTGLYDVFKHPHGGVDIDTLDVPTFGEWLDRFHDNESVIISQVYAHYAALAMGGKGKAREGGDDDIVVWYDPRAGRPTTDERYFRLPGYLRRRSVHKVVDRFRADIRAQFDTLTPEWPHRGAPEFRVVKVTPHFARWQAENFLTMVVRERVGTDDVPDLVMVNLKSTDAIGHVFGHDHRAYADALREVDTFLGKLMKLLDARAGEGRWALAITADHGLSPDDARRRVMEDLAAQLNEQLPDGDGDGKGPVVDGRAYMLFVDTDELAQDGLTLKDVRAQLEKDPDVRKAWTAADVEAVQRKLAKAARPQG